MSELVVQYGDLPFGGADAAVVAIAERLGLPEVATLDRRHFSVVRPRHVPAFGLRPWLLCLTEDQAEARGGEDVRVRGVVPTSLVQAPEGPRENRRGR